MGHFSALGTFWEFVQSGISHTAVFAFCWFSSLVHEAGEQGEASPQKHLSLEQLGKVLLNSMKIRAIFVDVSDTSGSLYWWNG